MKGFFKFLTVIILICFLVSGCCNDNKAVSGIDSEEVKIMLKAVEGEVTVKLDREFTKARKGMELETGDVVKVGKKGLAVIAYPGKYEVYVDKNSEVSVKKISVSGKKGFFGTVFHLFRGMIYSKVTIDTKQGDRYSVETDHVVAGVHGTQFIVRAEEDGSYVYVQEGVVKTRGLFSQDDQDDKEVMIGKYQMTKVVQDSVPLPPSSYNPVKPPFVSFWKKVENIDIKDKGKEKYKKH